RRYWPPNCHHQWTTQIQAIAVKRHRAGENRDDGKRDCKIRKPSDSPKELLGVAKTAQVVWLAAQHGQSIHSVVLLGCHADRDRELQYVLWIASMIYFTTSRRYRRATTNISICAVSSS